MNLDADQVIQQIEQKKFPSETKSTTKTSLTKQFASIFKPLINFIDTQIQRQQPGQVNLKIGTQTVISLELNVINMPYSSIRPLKRLVSGDGSMPANVYIMMSNPHLNRSKFRIDRVDSTNAFTKSASADLLKIQQWVQQQFKKIKTYQAEQAKIPKATKKAKAAHRTRKTTRRRRTRRTRRRKRK